MKLEETLSLRGTKVVLVPYKQSHVPKYHEWMGDEEILRLTGSDRLTLEEEFEMQQKWAQDDDKCTFIILDAEKFSETEDEVSSMVGDTNLFFDKTDPEIAQNGEIEIMIAEMGARRKGLASEALSLMIKFAQENLQIYTFFAKIKDDNASSIRLFQKLGFKFESKTEIFQEVTYVLRTQNDNK